MNARAIYWATKAIAETLLIMVAIAGIYISFYVVDTPYHWAGGIIWALLGFWSLRDQSHAFRELKAEANRGTELEVQWGRPGASRERLIP